MAESNAHAQCLNRLLSTTHPRGELEFRSHTSDDGLIVGSWRMDRERLLLLEKAAVDVLSPPFLVSGEQRRKAEEVFLDLRKAIHPYELCKYMLEHSQSDYVLFQAASTIKDAIIREWLVLPGEEKESLKNYIIQYLTTRPHLVNYVREQLVRSVALMVKRAALEVDKRELFNSILSTVSQLLTMDASMRHLGCSLLSALLVEFSHKSTGIGLPVEFHTRCKEAFQEGELLQILLTMIQVLQQYLLTDSSTPLGQEDSSLLSSFLRLTSQILNWNFTQFALKQHWQPDQLYWTPPKSYLPTFFDPSLLDLFFKLLRRVLRNEDHLHHVVQCLTQLASLVSNDPEKHQSYLANFVTGILEHISSSSNLMQQEVYGLSCVLRRLAVTHFRHHLHGLDPTLLELLMQSLAQLTCLCAQQAVWEEEHKEDTLTYQESLEHFLEVWVNILEEGREAESSGKPFPHHQLSQSCVAVFVAYVQGKLSAPRGWRTVQRDEDEIVEIVEDDRTVFADQLCSLADIAHTNPGYTLPLLVSLLEQCTSECLQLLSVIQQDHQLLSSSQNNLDSLYEDLHWLMLISCYAICNATCEIPSAIMQYSISLQADCLPCMAELDISKLVLQGGEERVNLSAAKVDPIVALVVLMCRLCVMEELFISGGLLEVLSPQLCETTLWCLSKVVEPYLLLEEESSVHDQLSLSLLSVFGRDTPSSRWLVSFLLEKVAFNLSVWSAEEKVTMTTTQLLKSITRSRHRAAEAIECDALWSLMRSFASSQPPLSSLTPCAQRTLMQSLVLCAVGDRKQQFLTELLQPFRHRFTSLTHRPDFQAKSQDGEVQQELLAILEALCGLAQSTWLDSVQEYFVFLLPLLQACVPLLEVCADIPEVVGVIFELFALVAENYIHFLDRDQSVQLYETVLALMQTYSKCNTGKYRKIALVEEEQCEDLLQFMKMLIHLSFKSEDRLSDVMIGGVNIIFPLMTDEILKFPTLCEQCFELLNLVCVMFPEKVADLVCASTKLLEAGLTMYTSEICGRSLDCVRSMAVHYYNTPHLHNIQPLTQTLQHFLKLLFEVMLSSSFDMDNIQPASEATFVLMCSHKEYYSSLASAIVSGQCDPQNRTRLVEAFGRLTPPSLPLELSGDHKRLFDKNLREFLLTVKGFLYYK